MLRTNNNTDVAKHHVGQAQRALGNVAARFKPPNYDMDLMGRYESIVRRTNP
jgi:hypothetical protein